MTISDHQSPHYRKHWSALHRWLLALLLACVASWASAKGSDLVVERAWLEDVSDVLSWADMQQMPMTPYTGLLSAGFGDHPLWIRLRIDPRPELLDGAVQLFLQVRPMYLDQVQLFDPLQTPVAAQTVGDQYPVSRQAEPANTFLFRIPVGTEPRHIWLRIRSTSTRMVHAEVLTPAALRQQSNRLNSLATAYLTLVISLCIWGITQMALRPEALMASFLVVAACSFALGGCYLGYLYEFWPARWPASWVDTITSLVGLASAISMWTFFHLLLNELSHSIRRNRLMLALLAVYGGLLILAGMGQMRQALSINMVIVATWPSLMFLLAWWTPARPSSPHTGGPVALSKRILMVYFGLTAISTVVTAMPGTGLVQGAEASLYWLLVYSLIAGVLMAMTLQYRASMNLRQQSRLRLQAKEAQALAHQEKAYRQEREHLLAMLGHELQTPLASIRMLMASQQMPPKLGQQVAHSVVEISQVVERAVQAGQLDSDAPVEVHIRQTNLGELVSALLPDLWARERVRISADTGDDFGVMTDPILLRVIVRNLLQNAIKYSPPASSVELQWGRSHEHGAWWLSVTNAPGRAGRPDPERVFDKYYRSPLARGSSGSGLGLYLASGLTKALGGRLRVDETSSDVCFRLEMPPRTEASS